MAHNVATSAAKPPAHSIKHEAMAAERQRQRERGVKYSCEDRVDIQAGSPGGSHCLGRCARGCVHEGKARPRISPAVPLRCMPRRSTLKQHTAFSEISKFYFHNFGMFWQPTDKWSTRLDASYLTGVFFAWTFKCLGNVSFPPTKHCWMIHLMNEINEIMK